MLTFTVHPTTAAWLRERIKGLTCQPAPDGRVVILLEEWQAQTVPSWLSELVDHWREKFEGCEEALRVTIDEGIPAW